MHPILFLKNIYKKINTLFIKKNREKRKTWFLIIIFFGIQSLCFPILKIQTGFTITPKEPYLYDLLIITQLQTSLKNRMVYQEKKSSYISVDFNFQKKAFFSICLPYQTIQLDKEYSGIGHISAQFGINILSKNSYILYLFFGGRLSTSQESDSYLSERDITSGDILLEWGCLNDISWNNRHKTKISFSMIKNGKTRYERLYDTQNQYSYANTYKLKINHLLLPKRHHKKFNFFMSTIIEYRPSIYDNLENTRIVNSNYLHTKLNGGIKWIIFRSKNIFFQYGINKYWLPYNLKVGHNFTSGIEIIY